MPRSSIPRRWRIFAEHLLREPNATWAARAAGIAEKSANRWAYKVQRDPRFVAYFGERLARAEAEAKIQTHRVLEELAIVAHSSVEDFDVDPATGAVRVKEGLPPERIRAIASVDFIETVNQRSGEVTRTAKLRLWDKVAAITNAMKHKALLVERHVVDATVTRGPGRLTDAERAEALAKLVGGGS